MSGFLGRDRLSLGPWSAFERALVRYFLHIGSKSVYYTGGPGDKGCDIYVLDSDGNKTVVQCKFTITDKPAGGTGVDDLRRACFDYSSNKGFLCVNSRNISLDAEKKIEDLRELGLHIEIWKYHALLSLSEDISEYSKQRKKPRKYQEDAIKAAVESLLDSGKALIEMATGLGKTIVLAAVIDRMMLKKNDFKVLILADKKAIVSQNEKAIWSQLSKNVITNILTGSEKPRIDNGVTIATFDSLISSYRNGKSIPHFDLILVDECHHSQADSYSEILELISNNCPIMGVTATPWRGDERDITEIFGPPVFQKGIIEGIHEGWLANINYEMFCDNVDWGLVKELSAEGHSIKTLNSKLFLPARDEELVEKVKSKWIKMGSPKIITFCKSKKHAELLASMFNNFELPSRYLTGDHSEKERATTFADYETGVFHNLIGVDILNEGVDIPDVEIVVFARVTHSRRIFVQQLGRGLRITDSKSEVTIMDFVADVRRLGALSKLNRSARKTEFYRDSGAELVSFDSRVKEKFVEEYLADVADLNEHEKPKLNFIDHSDIYLEDN